MAVLNMETSTELTDVYFHQLHLNLKICYPFLFVMVVMITIDVISGVMVAFAKKRVCSTISWVGITKKGLSLLIVLALIIMSPFVPNMPFHLIGIDVNVPPCIVVVVFYWGAEGLSIFENASILGLPVPAWLKEYFTRLQDAKSLNVPMTSTDLANLIRENVTASKDASSSQHGDTNDTENPSGN